MSEHNNLPSYVSDKKLEDKIGDHGIYMMELKYLDRDAKGDTYGTPAQRLYNISNEVAKIEKQYGASDEDVEKLTKKFYTVISNKLFAPGGRILSNVGTDIKALFNCYVLPIGDSMEEIYDSVGKAAIIHKNGGGTGYNITHMRPRGSYVTKSKGVASGPLSFLKIFDVSTETINSGNRRGANMAIMDVYHPDILEFIHAKTTEGILSNFNVSVGATNEFMKAVENDGYYKLKYYKRDENEKEELIKLTKETLENMIKETRKSKAGAAVGADPEPYSLIIEDEKIFDKYQNEEMGRISYDDYVELNANKILDRIASLAHKTGDPGIVFLDTIERDNPLKYKGKIEATNPCGEQPLHPYDACNLGSMNLSEMVKYENGKAEIDYNRIKKTTRTAVRFLDNCNDLNKGPIKDIEETVKKHRRIGFGVMGWADMLAKMEVAYGSKESLKLAEDVMKTITDEARNYSEKLAKEKGPFPEFDKSEYKKNGEPEVRNLQRTTIAPTGSISMLMQCNSGIEPYFGVVYTKNLRGGERVKNLVPAFVEAMEKRGEKVDDVLSEKIIENHGSVKGIDEVPKGIQDIFVTSHDISYEDHVKMQAAFQNRLDNAVSKTINMKSDATVGDVKKAYMLAWKTGCKGITIYRDKSKGVQVLETKKEPPMIHYKKTKLKNTSIDVSPGIGAVYYRVKKGNETLHTIITPKLFKVPKKNEYYIMPHAIFQNEKPLGSEDSAMFAYMGLAHTMVLKSEDPPYIELIQNMKSPTGDKQEGFGPNRIKTPIHGVGLSLEHMLLSHEILDYNEQGELIQLVKKKDLEEVEDPNKAQEIFYEWLMVGKGENKEGEVNIFGNTETNGLFECPKCGSHSGHPQENCPELVCNDCGWGSGKCD